MFIDRDYRIGNYSIVEVISLHGATPDRIIMLIGSDSPHHPQGDDDGVVEAGCTNPSCATCRSIMPLTSDIVDKILSAFSPEDYDIRITRRSGAMNEGEAR